MSVTTQSRPAGARYPAGPTQARKTSGPTQARTTHVVMVTNNALEDKLGGHERYVRELASALCQRDLAVTIVAKRWSADSPPQERCPDGVVIDRYAVPSKRNPLFAAAYLPYLARGIRTRTNGSGSGTVIHAHMALHALPLALSSTPFLLTFHAPVWRELLSERQGSYILPGPIQGAAVAALRRVERIVAGRATQAVVLSEFMRGELARLDPGAAERARLIPGGIDETRFHAGGAVRTSGDPPVLFTARRLTPRTGVDELIRAMPAVLRVWPGAKLEIAGTGAMQPGLIDLARRLGVAGNTDFLGRISDEELAERYRRASLVIVPTRELEGFGLSTAEALACGAAVLGTPAGATPELLSRIDPALVTRDTSADAIGAAILCLLDDPDRLERIRACARDSVLPGMSWKHIADRYIELYEGLGR